MNQFGFLLILFVNLLTGHATIFPTPKPQDVTFYIYTRDNSNNPDVLDYDTALQNVDSTHYKPNAGDVFMFHDQGGRYNDQFCTPIKNAVLSAMDVNMIVVDWRGIASRPYLIARGAVETVGTAVGSTWKKFMQKFQFNGTKVTLIGFGLGAHMAGVAARKMSNDVALLMALDPSGIGFTPFSTDRILPTDAKAVQIEHTSTLLYGYPLQLGTLDFYANGGKSQPGCGLDLLGTCSHEKSIWYLLDAVAGRQFTAYQCTSYLDWFLGSCFNHDHFTIQPFGMLNITGTYYFSTGN